MNRPKDKEFDCLRMKREIQTHIYEETRDLNHEEFAQYVRDKIASSRFADLLSEYQPAREAS